MLAVDGTNAVMRRATVEPDVKPEIAAEDTVKRIFKAAADLEATHLVVALDSTTCWRYEVFPDYKGAQSAPSSLATTSYSLALGERLESRGVRVIAVNGYEADDLLATLAHRLVPVPNSAPRECAILSSDNDLLQLTWMPHLRLMQYAPKGTSPWLVQRTELYCMERFGVIAERYPDFLALVGGKNKVPGLPKVGEKRAAKLLQKASLATLISDGIVPAEQAEWMRTALRLHTLDANAPLGVLTPKNCKIP
jgi:DNA polymerase-1